MSINSLPINGLILLKNKILNIISAIMYTVLIVNHNDILFSEMAERHNVPQVMMMARDLVNKVQTLIENK